MKKLLVILTVCLVVILSACSSSTQPEIVKETKSLQLTVGTFTENDLVFMIDDEKFPLNTDVSSLLEAFGEDFSVSTAPSCLYDGEDKVFDYTFASIFTYPSGDIDLIDEIYIFDGDYQTPKGIKIGSTLSEVKAQYGSEGNLDDSFYVYVLSGDIEDMKSPKLFFDISDDKVVGISFYAASNITE